MLLPLRKRAGTAALTAILVLAGCGDDSSRGVARDRDYRARAEQAEAAGEIVAAFDGYRDAARRFPTAAWAWSGTGRAARALGRFREAEGAYREAVRWDSTLVGERDALAELALADGRTDDALRWIDEVVRLGGESPHRHALRARVLAEAGRVTEAHKEIERALAAAPDDPEVHIARAFLHLRADSTTLALVALDGLALDHPDHPEVLEARAEVRRALGNAEGAIADLEKALESSPRRPRARLALARLLQEEARLPEAADHYRSLLENNPRQPAALEGLGECARAAGDPEAAEAAFRDAIEADPELAPAHLALGRLLSSQGRMDEAVALLRKARARATTRPALFTECSVALAELHLRLNEPRNALEIAEGILAKVPDSAEGRRLRGRALAAGGGGAASGEELEKLASRPEATAEEVLAYAAWLLDRGRAREVLDLAQRFLEVAPGEPRARVYRAEALAVLGRTEEAEAELHDVLAKRVPSPEAHLALARLYLGAKRWADAIFQAREGEKLAPDDPNFTVAIGTAALELGRYDAARAAFERERILRPESAKPWINLGKVALRAGEPGAAATSFRTARQLDPEAWTASYLLGLAEDRAGRPAEAVAAYRTVLAKNERVVEAHNNLAWLLADEDFDPVLAEVHARRAAELAPDNPHVLGTLGWALYKNHLLDEAATTLEGATRRLPEDPMKRYMLGVVQLDRGRTDEARREIETALRLDPAFERAGEARELLEKLGG